MQCDLWFPEKVVPDGAGHLIAPPVLTLVAGYSRFLMALMLPSRTCGDLLAGMWSLLAVSLQAVPKMLVWDNEAGIGQHKRLTLGARSFAGTLGMRIYQTAARDPEAKGMVERANGFLQTSFMPGRSFTGGTDFNSQLAGWLPRANTRLVRATGARPIDLLAAERAAMGALPPLAPQVGTSARVRVSCAGTLVADHARSWSTRQVITDPAHVHTAAGLREAFQQRATQRTEASRGPSARLQAGHAVGLRALTDYDDLFDLTRPASQDVAPDLCPQPRPGPKPDLQVVR